MFVKRFATHLNLFFSFPGSWSVSDLFVGSPFGEVTVDLELFPSLRCIGLNEIATVNGAFFNRFKAILGTTQFKKEVRLAIRVLSLHLCSVCSFQSISF